MSNIIIYYSTGKILRNITAPPDMLQIQIQEGEFGLENIEANLTTDYMLDGVVTERPTQGTTLSKTTLTADGIDSITILNAPEGIFSATNTVTKEAITGSINGTDTFSTTIAGTYKITIEAFPYLPFETTIEAI